MQTSRKPIAVLDANAFISMSSINNLASTTRLITTSDVLLQLKDLKTKQFVDSFPFQIEIIDSDDKVLELVKEFAKKTGDIASLSQVDMELIAITYALYKKEGLQAALRKDPPPILEKDDLEEYAKDNQMDSLSESEESEEEDETKHVEQKIANDKEGQKQQAPKEQEQWISVPVKPKRKVSSSSSDQDDQQGWITSKNYEKKMAEVVSNFKQQDELEQGFNIWLVSADFALQNVAVQMGIKLLSLDGRKINSIRRFIYECYLCWKKYRIYDEKVRICSNCGYNSLSKIAYSLDAQGHMILHRKKGWKPNQKILEVKQRKFEEQEKKKKHQNARRKKQASIFEN